MRWVGWEHYSLTQFIKGPQLVESLKLQQPQYHLKANVLSLSQSVFLLSGTELNNHIPHKLLMRREKRKEVEQVAKSTLALCLD